MLALKRPHLVAVGCMVAFCVALGVLPAHAAPPQNGSVRSQVFGLTIVDQSPTIPSDLQSAYSLAFNIATEHPDDYGFPTVDNGMIRLPAVSSRAVTIATDRSRAAAERLADEARFRPKEGDTRGTLGPPPAVEDLERITVVPTRGSMSLEQLWVINDAVFELNEDPRFTDAGITASGIDGDGQVILTVDRLIENLATELLDAYGPDTVVIAIEPDTSAELTSRQSDTSPYYGGAMIMTPSGVGCTSGFAWASGTTSMLVTAGHCSPNGGTYKAPNGAVVGTVLYGNHRNWNSTTGSTYITGQSVYRGDLALITVPTPASSHGRIYTGNSTSNSSGAVTTMSGWSAVGEVVRTGGRTTGELIGWKVDQVYFNMKYDEGTTLRNGTRAYRAFNAPGLELGDSGGPVYSIRPDGTVAAKGIISGRGSNWLCDKRYAFFTDIKHVYDGMPGLLALG